MGASRLFTIIVADDEQMIRKGLADNVPWNDLGFELLAACKDSFEVLNHIRGNHVDAVLTDIQMPNSSGIELAKIIRMEAPETFMIFLTAHSDFEYAQRAIEHGVWRYLVKPIKYAELLETLRELYEELIKTHSDSNEESFDMELKDPIVHSVETYIRCHYTSASLSEIAFNLDFTPEYLSKIFFDRSGSHFSDYLKEIRMKEAAKLLTTTKFRIAEISDIVGYSHSKNFTRTFRKHFNRSPRDYRVEGR